MRLRYALRLGLAASMLALAGCTVTMPVADGTWTAECAGVIPDDCEGVAEVFVNNLAWSGEWIRESSGGHVRISPVACPAPVEGAEWADLSACWRAAAPIQGSRACMLIARRKDPTLVGFPFGQVGGDNYTGLFGAPDPGTTPC